MGGRKLHFDVRKNQERKGSKARSNASKPPDEFPLIVSVPLDKVRLSSFPQVVTISREHYSANTVVSIPLSVYTSASAPDITVLRSRLNELKVVPPGWIAADTPVNSLHAG